MARTVGEVAELANVTVRTLHHYDAIGLVRPSGRTDAGYRLYDEDDLARLQQVLFYRELGFSLEDIRGLMADPGFDRGEALRDQRKLLEAETHRLTAMLAAVDAAIDAHEKGTTMTEDELFSPFRDWTDEEVAGTFDGFDPREHEAEAHERWGQTDAYRISAQRTKGYSKADWAEIRAESDAIMQAFAEALRAGEPATSATAMDAAEAARRQIDERFYPCPHGMHVGLGDMYVADPRFTATYEEVEPGLATYVRDAIRANAARAGV